MCGIAGLFALNNSAHDGDQAAVALAMADTLAHRGPDGRDSWGDAEAGIGLGHRRLSIIDLSPTGAQPMHSADGRYVISYNGEVYNFHELRSELEVRGHKFRGTSDTEVMLSAFSEWGVEAAVSRFAGMFAFAVFDRKDRKLFLVRDRIGVKPLYWTVANGTLLFGSELRALMAHSEFCRDVDREAVDALVRYSYVPAPTTIFRNVYKLPPGSILTARAGTDPAITAYWRLDDIVARPHRDISPSEATEELDRLLRKSIRGRLISDVPLGAFLSGGTDSSTVVALMQAESTQAARTFTIGFGEDAYNEAAHAREIARHLGTAHTEAELAPKAALDLVGNVADWFDEPFADSSQLPTYLVSRMARAHVTVALSGDGGDELFAGYPKYRTLGRLWRWAGLLPRATRRPLAAIVRNAPEPALKALGAIVLDQGRAERLGEKAQRLSAAMQAESADDAAMELAAVGLGDGLVVNANGDLRLRPCAGTDPHLPDPVSRMQAHDMRHYLPDDILTKVDRCSMAVSLEAREPLLDHRLVEFVWSLPRHIRAGDGRPKALLRSVLDRYVPRAMTGRPKRGFSVPLGKWLTGPWRGWADELLDPAQLKADGIFDAERVRSVWERHISGRQENATGLWNILMVRAWSKRWLGG